MTGFTPTDVNRASFQYNGYSYLFRHLQSGGTIEFLTENYRGRIITSVIDSTTSSESFIQDEIKMILDGVQV